MNKGGKRALVHSDNDNVATVVENVEQGDAIVVRMGTELLELRAVEAVPFGFKVAIRDVAAGEEIYKYGGVMGVASRSISKGELVHIHNVDGIRGRGDLETTGGAR